MRTVSQTIVINLATAITIFTQCPDVASLWDPDTHPNDQCWSPKVQEYTGFFQGGVYLLFRGHFENCAKAFPATNSATDLVLTLIPVYAFAPLKMNMTTKLGLVALLCLSIL